MKLTLFLKLAHLLNCQKTSKGPLYLSNREKISRDLTYFLVAKGYYSFHHGYLKSHYFPVSTCWQLCIFSSLVERNKRNMMHTKYQIRLHLCVP